MIYNYDSHLQSTVNSLMKTSRHLSFKLQSKLEVTKIWQNPSNNETIFSIQVLLFTFRWGQSFTKDGRYFIENITESKLHLIEILHLVASLKEVLVHFGKLPQ